VSPRKQQSLSALKLLEEHDGTAIFLTEDEFVDMMGVFRKPICVEEYLNLHQIGVSDKVRRKWLRRQLSDLPSQPGPSTSFYPAGTSTYTLHPAIPSYYGAASQDEGSGSLSPFPSTPGTFERINTYSETS
jgi:hypothetical protein